MSSVAIGKDADVQLMVDVAKWGKGRFYYTEDSQTIPRIFTLETQLASKASLVEQPFKPQLTAPGHEAMQDIDWKNVPPLGGYVATTVKSTAELVLMSHQEDPVLATWRYGVGRSAAFTSDAKAKWSVLWLRWRDFNKFWAQLTRWTLRSGNRSDTVATVERRDGVGEVLVDAVDSKGEFINFLDSQVGVVAPNKERTVIDLEQVAPGRYRGRFPAPQEGVYLVGMAQRRQEQVIGSQLAGLVVPYARELRDLGRRRDVPARAGGADRRRQPRRSARRVPQGAPAVADRDRHLALARGHRRCHAVTRDRAQTRRHGRSGLPGPPLPAARRRAGTDGEGEPMSLRSARRWSSRWWRCWRWLRRASGADAAPVKSRVVLVAPFDASALDADDRWVGEAVGEVLAAGPRAAPGLHPVERARLRAAGRPKAWGDEVVQQAARTHPRGRGDVRARDARPGSDLVIQPRLLDAKAGQPRRSRSRTSRSPTAQLLAKLAHAARAVRARDEGVAHRGRGRAHREGGAADAQPRARSSSTRARTWRSRAAGRRRTRAPSTCCRAPSSRTRASWPRSTRSGTVHQALGNRWKAAAQFRAATQLDPSPAGAVQGPRRPLPVQPRRLFDQALEAYAKAIELRPFYADAHVGLGDARAAKGDTDGAIKAYQQALVHNAVNPRVHMSLGKIYFSEKGLYYESVNAYKKAIDLDSASVEARMGLGEVYEDKGLYKEAADEYRKVIELDGKHTGAMYNLAIVYEKTDPREAIAQWERYIALASQLPSEKDWVDVARQHLRKLKSQVKD